MNVVIAYGIDSFASSNPTVAADLAAQLRRVGHRTEEVGLPYLSDGPRGYERAALAARAIELRGVDLVVAMGHPAASIRHERTLIWVDRSMASWRVEEVDGDTVDRACSHRDWLAALALEEAAYEGAEMATCVDQRVADRVASWMGLALPVSSLEELVAWGLR